MAKPTVLVTRHLPDGVEARLASMFDARLNTADDSWSGNGEEIVRRVAESGATGLLCAAGDALNAQTIGALPGHLRIIATFSVGTDHIDLEAARARGIVVTNTPDVLSFATAEIAFTLILMAARRAGEGERLVRAGGWTGWAPTQLMGMTLEGKKLGVLGFGRIGRELAQMARGMRMEIHYRNRSRVAPDLEQGAVYHDSDEGFLAAIDVLSMHIPGGAATAKWLNAERLAAMKPGAIVVNTGRGTTVDDAALVAALRSGHIAAAGLDVYDGEPRVHAGYLPLENVALLPHLGSATVETRQAMGERCIENLAALLIEGQTPPHCVG
jgi:lactate dehydrogenase-like 2-hydroxyacid dehydrogenase